MGPTVERLQEIGALPAAIILPQVVFKPTTPQRLAGILIDPPISEPVSKPVIPDANAAAEPPDDPPGLLVKSQGLFVVP